MASSKYSEDVTQGQLAAGPVQRLVNASPPLNAQIDHQHGAEHYRDPHNGEWIDQRDDLTVVVLYIDAWELSWTATGKGFKIKGFQY